jgi:hypothetical protein
MLAQEVMQGDQQAIQKASQLVGPQMLQAALQGDEQAGMALGLFVQQNGSQVVEVRNAVNELDVDIVIDEGMDTPTVQAEQFETIAKLMANAPALQANPGALEFLVEASALRNKDKLLDILNQGPPPEQVQAQQQMQQLQMAGAEAEVEKTKSETLKNVAQAQAAGTPEAPQQPDPVEQARVMLEGQQTQIDGFRAETERMEALKPNDSSTSR